MLNGPGNGKASWKKEGGRAGGTEAGAESCKGNWREQEELNYPTANTDRHFTQHQRHGLLPRVPPLRAERLKGAAERHPEAYHLAGPSLHLFAQVPLRSQLHSAALVT